MYKKLILINIIIITLLLLWGCAQKKNTNKQNVKTATISSVKIENHSDFITSKKPSQAVISQEREAVKKNIVNYIEAGFLNVENEIKTENIADFFSAQDQKTIAKDITTLTLGTKALRLDSISKNELKIPSMAINYNKEAKPALSSVKISFNALYKAGSKKINLNYVGWLALEKANGSWKIFDYRVKQDLE